MTSEKNKCTVLCFAGRWPQTNAHAFAKIKGQVSWPGEDVGGWKKVETVLRNRQSHGARSNGREAEIMGLSGQVCPLAQIVDERNRGTKSWQGARKKMRRHSLKSRSGGWGKLQILWKKENRSEVDYRLCCKSKCIAKNLNILHHSNNLINYKNGTSP